MSDRIQRYWAAAFGFALMAAYWPGIAGAATTSRWDVGVVLAVALFFVPRIEMSKAHWIGLAILAWLLFTLLWSEGRQDGIGQAVQLVLIAIAFAVGSTLTDARPLVIGAALGLTVSSSAAAILQYAGWNALPSYGAYPSGLFFNGDRLAAAAAVVAVAALAMRLWWAIPGLVPSLLLPHCRAALLAVVVSIAVSVFQKYRTQVTFWALAVWPLLFAFTVGLLVVLATASYNLDAGITQRFEIWSDTIAGLNWSGHGLGSFFNAFPKYGSDFIAQAHSRPFDPHNEFLWLAFEGGPIAVVLAVAFVVRLWRASGDQPMRYVLVAVGVLACFAQPFHDPTILFVALWAGYLAGGHVLVRLPAVGRGGPLRAWIPGIEGGMARGGIRPRLAPITDGGQHERA
jgi:hypothetical protein